MPTPDGVDEGARVAFCRSVGQLIVSRMRFTYGERVAPFLDDIRGESVLLAVQVSQDFPSLVGHHCPPETLEEIEAGVVAHLTYQGILGETITEILSGEALEARCAPVEGFSSLEESNDET